MQGLWWSLKQIRKAPFESFLIILAIGLGIGALCSVTSLLVMLNQSIQQVIGYENMIEIRAIGRGFTGYMAVGSEEALLRPLGRVDEEEVKLTLQDVYDIKRDIPAAKYVLVSAPFSVPLQSDEAPPQFDFHTREGQERYQEWYSTHYVSGTFTLPEAFEAENIKFASGGAFLQQDVDEGRLVAVLGSNAAQRLLGTQDAVGNTFTLNLSGQPKEITVVGVMEHISVSENDNMYTYSRVFNSSYSELNDVIILPYTVRNHVYQAPVEGEVDTIYIVPREDIKGITAVERVRSYVSREYGYGVSVISYLENIAQAKAAISNFAWILSIFGSLALVIAAINTLNLMIARVLKRNKTIALTRALGLTKRGSFYQFLQECVALSFGGMVVGIGLTYLFIKLSSLYLMENMIQIPVSWEVWAVGMGIATLCTLVFGIYPAVEASRINCADALRMD